MYTGTRGKSKNWRGILELFLRISSGHQAKRRRPSFCSMFFVFLAGFKRRRPRLLVPLVFVVKSHARTDHPGRIGAKTLAQGLPIWQPVTSLLYLWP